MINAQAYGIPQIFSNACATSTCGMQTALDLSAMPAREGSYSAAAFPVSGTMYIALVATVPESHGKGYAEAVMRHTIEQAAPSDGTGAHDASCVRYGAAGLPGDGFRAGRDG